MGTPLTIDVFDREPKFDVRTAEVKNYTQQKTFEYRPITDCRNREVPKLCYPDHPNEIPQPHQSMGLLDEVQALKEQVQNLSTEVRQNKESQDNFQKSVEVDRKFSEMVQGSSPLFAVQDLVKELVQACDDKARKCIPQFPKLQGRFPVSETRQVPGAYDWLLKQLAKGDGDARECSELVHTHVPEMPLTFDVKAMLASLTSYREAKKQRDLRGHPCSRSPKVDDIIRFVETLVKGENPLPEPYKDTDKRLVEIAVSHWLKTHKQKAGPVGRFKRVLKRKDATSILCNLTNV